MKDKGKKKKLVKKKKFTEKRNDKEEDKDIVDFTIGNGPYEEDWDFNYENDYYNPEYEDDYDYGS